MTQIACSLLNFAFVQLLTFTMTASPHDVSVVANTLLTHTCPKMLELAALFQLSSSTLSAYGQAQGVNLSGLVTTLRSCLHARAIELGRSADEVDEAINMLSNSQPANDKPARTKPSLAWVNTEADAKITAKAS